MHAWATEQLRGSGWESLLGSSPSPPRTQHAACTSLNGRIGILGCVDLKKEAGKEEEEENPVWDVLVIETMEMTQVKIRNYTFWHCIVGPQLDFSRQNMLEKQYGISWPLRLWIWLKPKQGKMQDTFLIVGQLKTFPPKKITAWCEKSVLKISCCVYTDLCYPCKCIKIYTKAKKTAFIS